MPVTDTSRASFADLLNTLSKREQAVWIALARWTAPPTAYELTDRMMAEGTAFDLNSVRPRLTSLREKGCVETVGRRQCLITGKLALTWRVKLAHPPTRRLSSRPHRTSAVEQGLF